LGAEAERPDHRAGEDQAVGAYGSKKKVRFKHVF
jgi:hypothetical protein